MTKIILNLQRETGTDQGTFGKLSGEGLDLHTLELPWRNNQSKYSCIPPGEYLCSLCESPRFGKVYEVSNVPGRTHILIHSGNFAGDTTKELKSSVEGCILLGLSRGKLCNQDAVLQSRNAVKRFMQTMNNREFVLKIQRAE
ncbi:DUF5675 family protein [Desulfosarcina sp. OttesenSCG-928-B08]|nr:DUF5675 family protein [Desulfosarcina sp. OttesenSCG-928-B08]